MIEIIIILIIKYYIEYLFCDKYVLSVLFWCFIVYNNSEMIEYFYFINELILSYLFKFL